MEADGGVPNNKEDHSKSSSDEHDSSADHPTDDTSTAGSRFYECIFCKRGFSTAQALGGHMNIHRKDRAKMRHTPSPSSKPGEDESESGYGYHNPYPNHSNHRSVYRPVSESLKNYSMLLPASSASSNKSDARKELSLFGEDLGLGLRVHGVGRQVVVGGEARRERGEEDEVDLELRLGHEP